MARQLLNNRIGRTHFACFALFALLLQGLMPPGYMPDFSRHQLFAITICTGTGRMNIMVPGQHKNRPQEHQQTTCPFAMNHMASLGDLPGAPIDLLILSFIAALIILPSFRLPAMRTYDHAAARAPPHLS